MTIQQIELVITAAEEGSFTRTAARLFQSQSNVSNSVKALERELGYLIFKRTSAGLILTPQGKHFVEHAQAIRRHLLMITSPKNEAPAPQRFSLGYEDYILCARAFTRYCTEAARLGHTPELTCLQVDHQRGIDKLVSGELDLLVGIAIEDYIKGIEQDLNRRCLILKPICSIPMSILVCRDHPLAQQAHPNLGSIKNFPYVDYISGTKDYILPLIEKATHMKISYRYQIAVNSLYVCYHTVSVSNACMISAKLPKTLLEHYGLVCCDLPLFQWKLYAALRDGEESRVECIRYLDLLNEELQSL